LQENGDNCAHCLALNAAAVSRWGLASDAGCFTAVFGRIAGKGRTLRVRRQKRRKALQAHLQLDSFVIQYDVFDFEVDPNGGDESGRKRLTGVSEQQAGFTDT
jgi:hypothetical protein